MSNLLVLTIDDFDLKSKTIFLRVDVNYPINPCMMEVLGTKRIDECMYGWMDGCMGVWMYGYHQIP